jgi:DNA-directed RNA polymerase I, II, and III subunit RPABC5
MLIPVRCFTCNKVIGHLWEPYVKKLQIHYNDIEKNRKEEERLISFKLEETSADKIKDKSFEGKLLDEMGLNKYCCRTTMLSNVDLTTKI